MKSDKCKRELEKKRPKEGKIYAERKTRKVALYECTYSSVPHTTARLRLEWMIKIKKLGRRFGETRAIWGRGENHGIWDRGLTRWRIDIDIGAVE